MRVSNAGGGRSGPLGGLLTVVRDAPMRWLGGTLGVVVFAVSGLLGGLDDVGEPKPPDAGFNVLSKGEPWNVKVTGGRVAGDLPPLRLSQPENRWLVVIAEVEVTAEASREDVGDIIRVPNATGLVADSTGNVPERAAEIVNMRDSTRVSILHPRMVEKIAFFWEQRGTEPMPATVDVAIWEKKRARSVVERQGVWPDDGRLSWRDPALRVIVVTPVQDVRAASSPSTSATPSVASSTSPSVGLASRGPSSTPGRTASPTPSRPAPTAPSRTPSVTPTRTR